MATTKKKTEKPAKITAKKSPTKKPAVKAEPAKVYFAPPSPQLNDAPTFPVVNAKCKRGSDRMSEGQSCPSLTAENMTRQGASVVQFRCTKCKYAWAVPMGGSFQGV